MAVENASQLPRTPVTDIDRPLQFSALARGDSDESVLGRLMNAATASSKFTDAVGTTKFTRDWNKLGSDGMLRRSPISFDRPGMLGTVYDSPTSGSPNGSESDATVTHPDTGEFDVHRLRDSRACR